MRWLAVLAALAGCGTDSPPCKPGAQVCVTFDDGALPPDYWSVTASGSATGAIERTHSHSGARALHITATLAPGSQWMLQTSIDSRGIVDYLVHAFIYVPALPTAEVTLFTSADSTTTALDARLEPDGSLVNVGHSSTAVVVRPGEWTAVDVDAGYSSTQTSDPTLSFGVLAAGTGEPFEIWYDDLSVFRDISI